MKPLFNTDMPDPDIIRVGNDYYMVSTTMFMMPGAPILTSKDLVNWKIISYVFTTIEDHENYRLENGKHGYGKGQWATSLAYHNGLFYACFVCHDMGKTFIYSTDNPAKSGWNKLVLDQVFHDMSFLFFENHSYLIYGNGNIMITELEEDLSGIKKGGRNSLLFEADKEGIRLRAEGCRALVKDGMIYLFFIEWPEGGIRREVCYRASSLDESFEKKVVFENCCGREGRGVAQGLLIDDGRDNWYAVLFQDRGASGRIPFLFKVSWEEGWPVISGEVYKDWSDASMKSGLLDNDFTDAKGELNKSWQWNHNPIEDCYSLVEVAGGLRLVTGHIATGLLDARNTITHRTVEPGCTFMVQMDCSHLKTGDYAGICAFQGKYGQIGVEMTNDGPMIKLKCKQGASFGVGAIVADKDGQFEEWTVPATIEEIQKIHFRIDYDYNLDKDIAEFYYSFDGNEWIKLGDPMKMIFTLDMFIGYKCGIFCYATNEIGGYVDVSNPCVEAWKKN